MDDEIADAISRLLIASGSPAKAKQYLEAYINAEESLNIANISTLSSDSADSPAAAILPPPFSSSMENPWQEDGNSAARDSYRAKLSLSPRPNATPPPQGTARDGVRYASSLTDGSPAWGDSRGFSGSLSSLTPVWLQSDHTRTAKTLDRRSLLSGMHGNPSPAPTVSTLSQESDQPLSLSFRSLSLAPGREPSRVNRIPTAALTVGSTSPSRPRKTPSNGACLHPDLAAIRSTESTLSRKDLRLKIQADPDYVGALPFIRVQNPQYRIKTLVHLPPKISNGKWYLVSRGTSVGIFNNWGPAAKATQGVPKAVYKSFLIRGDAIVAYQVALLRGEVLLINEKVADDDGEADNEGQTDDERDYQNMERRYTAAS